MKTFFRKLDLTLGGIYTALLLAAVIALVIVAVGLGRALVAERGEAAKLDAQRSALEQVKQEVLALERTIQEIRSRESAFSALVPTRKQFLNNIELLETSAKTTANNQSISITEIPPGVKTPALKSPVPLPAKYDFANYNINLTGGFINLVKYLKLLENEPFLMLVKSISIDAEKQQGGFNNQVNTGLLKTTIEGTFFFSKD